MPKFKYIAKGIGQDTLTGLLEAENEDRAVASLQQQGLFPIQIIKEAETVQAFQGAKRHRIKKKELSLFIRQLYDMISSGVSLLKALEIVESQIQGKAFKEVVQYLIGAVRGGQKFSEALRAFPSIFSPFFVNLVRSGEASGALDQVLMRLADFAEAQEETQSRVKAALAYPVFISAVGFCVIFILLAFVVPRMAGIFEDLGQRLPFLTKLMILVGHWIGLWWWLIIVAFILMGMGLKMQLAKRESLRFWQKLLFNLPFFGTVHRGGEIARFARTLHMLLANGIPLIQALEIVEDTVTNVSFQDEIKDLRTGLSRGERIRDRLQKSRFLPINVVNMLIIGEETGQLERTLNRTAESFEKRVERDIRLATSILEPVMILVIGSVVGLIAMAMLLPIFQINFLIR
jgi:general secretion pathway protein F